MENKKLNSILAKMQVDYPSLAMSFVGFIFILTAVIGLFEHINVSVIICLIMQSLVCWIFAGILFQKHMKINYIPILISNMKSKGISADLQDIAKIEASLNEEAYVERRYYVITNKYFISFGKDNVSFEPVCIPLEMIAEVIIVDMHIGFGKAASDIAALKFKLKNEIEVYCCIGLKSQKDEIIILENAGIFDLNDPPQMVRLR